MEFGTWSSAGGRGECSSAAEMTPSPEVWGCSEIALAASKFLQVFVIFGAILVLNRIMLNFCLLLDVLVVSKTSCRCGCCYRRLMADTTAMLWYSVVLVIQFFKNLKLQLLPPPIGT